MTLTMDRGADRDVGGFPRPRKRLALASPCSSRLICVLLATSCTVSQAWATEAEIGKSAKPQERPVQLPPAPKADDLHPFYVSPTARQTFMLDLSSISTDDDGVVRYTLVSKSPSGALNISYEGIRCDPRERRVYAYGRNDGTWSPSSREEWIPIDPFLTDQPQPALARDYFCQENGAPKTLDAIVYGVRTNASAAPRGS
jgi:hypothetical protein